MNKCYDNEQINQNNENELNMNNKTEVININECIICDNKNENIDKKIIYLKKYNINNKNEEKSQLI